MNLISSIKRNQRKRMIIKSILSRPQKNTSVINIHRIDPLNVGDYFSAPHHYFKELKRKPLNLLEIKLQKSILRCIGIFYTNTFR